MPEKSSSHPQPVFISLKRAAQLLQVNPRTLWRYIDSGVGPPVCYFGNNNHKRTIRIRLTELMQWADERKK